MKALQVVPPHEWLVARRVLLEKEKELTRLRDELAAQRRTSPALRVEGEYAFAGPGGPVTLGGLFAGRPQLIVYHFMFDPAWEEGCPSCSLFADGFAGLLVHLAARNTSFAVISRAPLAKLEAFRKRMGWSFPWFSSYGSEFNHDFHVTLARQANSTEYNYADVADLVRTGKLWTTEGELPGLSVFLRQGADILHTYSAYARGLDALMGIYGFLDLTPLGRQELPSGNPQGWVRHHDRYAA